MSADTSLVQHNGSVPATKLRNIRVDDALWAAVKAIASDRRETVSAVIKRALVEYVERHGGSVER